MTSPTRITAAGHVFYLRGAAPPPLAHRQDLQLRQLLRQIEAQTRRPPTFEARLDNPTATQRLVIFASDNQHIFLRAVPPELAGQR